MMRAPLAPSGTPDGDGAAVDVDLRVRHAGSRCHASTTDAGQRATRLALAHRCADGFDDDGVPHDDHFSS
jgi:hypothetical protein